jgi:large subunit ribosomal protein L1
VADAITKLKAGQVEIRPDKQGVVHVPVGKIRFDDNQLATNIVALFDTVLRAKPAAAKGSYVRSVYLTSTMGPSIQLDTAKLTAATK